MHNTLSSKKFRLYSIKFNKEIYVWCLKFTNHVSLRPNTYAFYDLGLPVQLSRLQQNKFIGVSRDT